MAASPPIQIAQENWVDRLSSMADAGFKKKQIRSLKPIVEQDIKNVRLGGASMPDTDALLSMAAVLKRKPVVQKDRGGWSPDDFIGDVIGDIKDITWGTIPNMVRYIAELPKNAQITAEAMTKGTSRADNEWMRQHGFEPNDPISSIGDPSAWARQIRNIGKMAPFNAVPGVWTAGNLTTDKGRMEALHHPVFTGLDVLPVAGAATRGAAAAKFGRLTMEGSRLPYIAAKEGVAPAAGSAAEAAFQGRPVKAAYRGAVPEAVRGKIALRTRDTMRRIGIDPDTMVLSREHAIAQRRSIEELNRRVHESGVAEDIAAWPEESRVDFWQKLTRDAAYDEFTPEQQAVIPSVMDIIRAMEDENPALAAFEWEYDIDRELPITSADQLYREGGPGRRQLTDEEFGALPVELRPQRRYGPGETPDLSELDEARAAGAERRAELDQTPLESFEEMRGRRAPGAEELPPVPEGHTRVYHVARPGEGGVTRNINPEQPAGTMEVSSAVDPYLESFAAEHGGQVQYVDVPDAELTRSSGGAYNLDTGEVRPTAQHYYVPEEYRQQLKRIGGERRAPGEVGERRGAVERREGERRVPPERPGLRKTRSGGGRYEYGEFGLEKTDSGWQLLDNNGDLMDVYPTRKAAMEAADNYLDMYEGERRVGERRTGEQRGPERRALGGRRTGEERRTSRPLASEEEIAQVEYQAGVAEEAGNTELAAALRDRAGRMRGDIDRPMEEAVGREQYPDMDASPEAVAARQRAWDEAHPATSKPRPEAPEPYQGLPYRETSRRESRRFVYPKDSPVIASHNKLQRAIARLKRIREAHAPETRMLTIEEIMRRKADVDTATKRVRNAQKRLDAATREVAAAQESLESGRARGGNARLNRALDRHEKALRNLEARREILRRETARMENPSSIQIRARNKRLAAAEQRVKDLTEDFEKVFKRNPPASMQPMLQAELRKKLYAAIESQPFDFSGPRQGVGVKTAREVIDAAVAELERGDLSYLERMFPGTAEEAAAAARVWYNDLRRDVFTNWQKLVEAGHDPVWVHNTPTYRVGRTPNPRPLADSAPRVSQVKARVNDLTPQVQDVAVGLTEAMTEYVRRQQWEYFDQNVVRPMFARDWTDIREEVIAEAERMRARGEIPGTLDEMGAVEAALQKLYVEYTPEQMFSQQNPRLTGTATVGSTKTYVPRHVGKALEDLSKPPSQSALAKGARNVNKVYKTSVMAFSLKHMAHVFFGGLMFMLLRGGAAEWTSMREAWKMVREDRMPVELKGHIDVDSPQQLRQLEAKGRAAKAYENTLGWVAEKKWKFDETVIQMQRAMTFLGEQKRALRGGMSEAAAREAGLRHAYKTLVDVDGMAPIERNVLRQALPFYAFMRHTLRYVLTYPVDHPLRAAILSRMNKIEQEDWDKSGLPQAMQSLFLLGKPDAEGNVQGIEMRQFNPFRDVGDYFTPAGAAKSVHPLAGIAMTTMGLNKFTGSPELYPDQEIDKRTGNLVAKRPPNAVWNAITSLMPEAELIDYFGEFTDEMKELKARDADAAHRRLYQMAFVPFEPKKVNVNKEIADIQRHILTIASQDVSRATRTGRTGTIQQYPLVPYQGELVEPQRVSRMIDYVRNVAPGVAPKSVIPRTELSRIGF